MKRTLRNLILLAFMAIGFAGCSSESGPKTYIIASQKGAYRSWEGEGVYRAYNIVREKGGGEWFSVDVIHGMKFELGYEYVVEADLLTAKEQWEQDMIADAVDEMTVRTVISKQLKTTSLPEDEQSGIATFERYFLPDNADKLLLWTQGMDE